MGYNFFKITYLRDNFNRKYKAFAATLGSAVRKGANITFVDNDISYALKLQHERLKSKGLDMEYEVYDRDANRKATVGSQWRDAHYESYVCNEQYGLNRTVSRNGRKLFSDKKRCTLYTTITDVITGIHPDNETCSCPNCGNVSTVAQIKEGCPYCGTVYKMDDLFPKITSYYFIEDVALAGSEGIKTYGKFILITTAVLESLAMFFTFVRMIIPGGEKVGLQAIFGLFGMIPLGAILGYFLCSVYLMGRLIFVGSSQSSGKYGTIGSRQRFEERMKAISPEFSFEYFTSKAISLIKTAVYSENEQELLFYKGAPLDPLFKDIIDMNYGAALGLAGFKEENGRVYITTDAFFDVLYAQGDKIIPVREKYRAVFMRRTDIPIDLGFSISKIQCPTCGSSYNAIRNKLCPYCGHEYDVESEDWVLVLLRRT